ncbi:hypothetical protein CAL14_08400 [Bordetella genomosp. 9]|nr:hypothetical protein CAL14_08400 [Bordetella genomosp. 9]
MSVVDDFGRYFADPGMLRAACYPRQLSKVSDSDIGKWLTVCVEAALVRVYPAEDGERYLELLDFRQQVRAKASKFPQPPDDCKAPDVKVQSTCLADAQQALTDVHLDVVVDEDDIPARQRAGRSASPPLGVGDLESEGVTAEVAQEFIALRKRKRAPLTPLALSGIRREADLAGWTLDAALRRCVERGWQGFQASWVQNDKGSLRGDVDEHGVPL